MMVQTITVAAQNHPSTDAMRKMASEFEKLTGIKSKVGNHGRNSFT